MKNAAGLLVALGCFTITCHALGERSSRSASSEVTQAKAAELRSVRAASEPSKAESSADMLESSAIRPDALFAAADRDGDGSVTYGELTAVVRASVARRIKARFRQLDRNRDGRCTRAEVNKMNAARFARFDLNRDGHFTASELTSVVTRQLVDRLQKVYARLDADRDGRFTVAELTLPQRKSSTAVAANRNDAGQKQVNVAGRRSPNVH